MQRWTSDKSIPEPGLIMLHYAIWFQEALLNEHKSMVSCQKGPTRHA